MRDGGVASRWKSAVGALEILERDSELLQIVLARHPPRRLPRCLHGRQQQRDENADDRDDNEQFNQVEPPAAISPESGPRAAALHCHDAISMKDGLAPPPSLATRLSMSSDAFSGRR
jgi:hypothetical protein